MAKISKIFQHSKHHRQQRQQKLHEQNDAFMFRESQAMAMTQSNRNDLLRRKSLIAGAATTKPTNDELKLAYNSLNSKNIFKLNHLVVNNLKRNQNISTTSATSKSKTNPIIVMPKLNLLLTFITALVIVLSTMPTHIQATDLQQQEEILLEYDDIAFTRLNKNVSYQSSTKYYPRGMAPLYKSTNKVLDSFIGEIPIPPGYITVTENNVEFGPKVQANDWSDLLKHYWAILLVITITGLLVVLMPIIALCFCCCRCAGSCGGRSQPFDKKHDTCRRIFLGLLLICATTGILFGVVVTFATNSYMQEGIDTSTDTVRVGTQDIKAYLKATSEEIDYLVVNNYALLSTELQVILKNTSNRVITELETKSQAISLTHLTEFVNSFPDIKQNLDRMKAITNELRVNASQLSDGLRGVKRELLTTLNKCNVQDCKDVMKDYQIGKLDANGIDYNQLPDVTKIIDSVQVLLDDGVANSVTNGNEAIKKMKKELNEAILTNIPKVESAVKKSGDAIQDISNQMANYLDSMSNSVGNNSNYLTKEADKYLNEYSVYRFYVGVAISSILLLVLCALTVALLCGVCGKRPDGYGDDCCNKGSGSRFLMLAVTVIFLTISVLAVATLIHFLVGLILHRGLCVPLNNPHDEIFAMVDNYVDLNKIFNNKNMNGMKMKLNGKNGRQTAGFPNTGAMPAFRISNVILDCQQNKTLYDVLMLQNFIDIEQIRDYPERYDIYKSLEQLKDQIKIDTKNFEMLKDSDKKKIIELQDSELNNFEAYKFLDNLDPNVTARDLGVIANKLKETADNIHGTKGMLDVAVSLKNQALHLTTYQQNLVIPMQEHTLELSHLATDLEKNLKLKDKPFKQSIAEILIEIEEAQEFIRNDGDKFVQEEADKLGTYFKRQINMFLDFVIKAIEQEVGKCGPLANVYASSVVLGCNKIIDPFNGFWAGLGWCVLIFLPTLIISVKLSSLYQKSDPYPGPLVESEYLYDAYSERDNIPLANGPKNKRRKKDRSRGPRDRRGDYYEESGSSHAQVAVGSGGRDTRYNDMAPKHWDGGPPRYTNPPMAPPASEYERPPPYYYAGASEQE